jgi:hypothetical protein
MQQVVWTLQFLRCSTKKSVGVPFNGVVKVLAGFLKTSFVPPRASSCYIEEVGYFDDVELVRKEERDRKIYYRYYMY